MLDTEEPDRHGDASREQWWSHSGLQSDNGILLKVWTGNAEERGIRDIVTEVLLYAAVATTDPALPTPPVPSSPTALGEDFEKALNENLKTVKVFALPLCSNAIDSVRKSIDNCPPTAAESQSAGQACFLPYSHDPARVTLLAPQKRHSISTLFEDATQKRRRLKGRGGESISQAMAGIERLPSQHGMRDKQEAPQPQQSDLRRKSLSQASSMTSVAGAEQTRPNSRSGLLANGKRSSLHRVESAKSLRDSPTPSDADGSYAQQNKSALTKVVMTAMRLHGLQQKKKPPSKSRLPNQVIMNTEPEEAEDEYKLVYHQTFKAANFTFRKHLSRLLISQETMRDVVDRLLTMFCTDPTMIDREPGGSTFPDFEADSGIPTSSPFDKPSSKAQLSNVANAWNTPIVKKR